MFGGALGGYGSRFAGRPLTPLVGPSAIASLLTRASAPPASVWAERNGGSVVAVEVGEVYVGGSERIDEALLVEVSEPITTVEWRVFFKDGSARGSLTLRRRDQRPAVPGFGRLEGLLRYPDVLILDEDGEIAHHKRTQDPPIAPPVEEGDADADDFLGRMRGIGAFNDWAALGLDPAADGESVVSRVERAAPLAPPTHDDPA